MRSIRNQLLLWQISALIVSGLLVSFLAFSIAWSGFNKERDYMLEQLAYSIQRHGVESDHMASSTEDRDSGQFLSQIWIGRDNLIYASRPAPALPPLPHGVGAISWDGVEWHTFTLHKGDLIIQVANTADNRAARFARIAPWLLMPLCVLVAFLGGLIWIAVGRALRPLNRIQAEIGARSSSSMAELPTTGLPDELRPLVGTINDLLARLRESILLQRRFTADATHELRTPHTAVRLQAQIAQRAQSESERDDALQALLGGVDRAACLVEQLLLMTRLEPDSMPLEYETVPLRDMVRQVVSAFQQQARSRNIDLGLGDCDEVFVSGDAAGLRAMLNNLVGNALTHCPPGSHVDVELRDQGSVVELQVRDDGPGIPREQRQRVFDRFFRLPGTESIGSGLGLAIVRQAVAVHHGTVSMDEVDGGGLLVRVELPASIRRADAEFSAD